MEGTTYDLFFDPNEDTGYKVWTEKDGSVEAHGETSVHRFDTGKDFIAWAKANNLEYGGTERY